MFVIRLITIVCLHFTVYVACESGFCCVKHKYVQDTRGIYIKKCVLSTTCPRSNDVDNNNFILDEPYLLAQQNYVKTLKTSRNYNENFQNYIKHNENFAKELENYIRGVKTTDKYTSLLNKYQQLEDEYNNYVQETFPNGEENLDRKRRSSEGDQVNNENNYKSDEDDLLARRNYLGNLKEHADKYQKYDEKLQNVKKNNENDVQYLQNYVTGVKPMDKYTNLVNNQRQLETEYNNHDKESFPNNDGIEESVDDIDTKEKSGKKIGTFDEDHLGTEQKYLKTLKEYADTYQRYDEKFQNIIKNYESYVKLLQNYVTGAKTTDTYTRLINKYQQVEDEYNSYVKEHFPDSENVDENQNTTDTKDKSGDNEQVNNEYKIIINNDYLVERQNYVKQLKDYADKYHKYDEQFQNYIKNNEEFVRELQNFDRGEKTMDKYTSLVNRYEQLQDDYNNYVKQQFSNSDKDRKRRSVESEEYSLYDRINPDATEYEKCLWKYNKYGSSICDQLKLLAYREKFTRMFPFTAREEYDSMVDKMDVDSGMDDTNIEDNNIDVLYKADGRSTKQNQRIDSLLTAGPNCFEGSGSLAYNNLCKPEFYDY